MHVAVWALVLAIGVVIVLAAACVYWGLEALLVGYDDHDRGLWEGAALVMVIRGGHALANRVLRQFDAKKENA